MIIITDIIDFAHGINFTGKYNISYKNIILVLFRILIKFSNSYLLFSNTLLKKIRNFNWIFICIKNY
jgi:seryl-tRNA synthetase